MENDSQNFQTLYCAWTLHGWREHKWEKKNERKKRSKALQTQEGYQSVYMLPGMLRTFSLTGHKKPLLSCKRFHTQTEAKSFFMALQEEKNITVQFGELQSEIGLQACLVKPFSIYENSVTTPSLLQIIGLKFSSSVTRNENWHLTMVRQVSKVLLLLLIS